jgi:beta-1,4-mannooligosaccharide/beta-1,4-mannosyl-N-acetylglucosamine phosphorylase
MNFTHFIEGGYMIIGENLPNMPWQDRPEGCQDIVWRYSNNPIIKRNQIPSANSIFNSAVIAKDDAFIGVFRSDDKAMQQHLFLGKSQNGIDWDIEHEPMPLYNQKDECVGVACGYDPRVCLIEDRYVVTWCNNYHGPTIGVAYSYDFKKFYQLENAFLPFNRNGVMFPRKIGNNFAMLSRPSDNGHTPFGDIFYSESPDMTYWGKHRHVMSSHTNAAKSQWQGTKVGAGPIPIETADGWLLIYHGVLNSCNGFVYSAGAAILDIDKPWKVKYRTAPYIMSPQTLYECVGDVPNVLFHSILNLKTNNNDSN